MSVLPTARTRKTASNSARKVGGISTVFLTFVVALEARALDKLTHPGRLSIHQRCGTSCRRPCPVPRLPRGFRCSAQTERMEDGAPWQSLPSITSRSERARMGNYGFRRAIAKSQVHEYI